MVDEGDQESESEILVSNDVMSHVAAAPASAPEDVATAGEEVEAESTKPTSPWIVLAPPEKLGIVAVTTAEGPVVHIVSVGPDDLITSIDGVRTARFCARPMTIGLGVPAR
jgi:hypothetical protein